LHPSRLLPISKVNSALAGIFLSQQDSFQTTWEGMVHSIVKNWVCSHLPVVDGEMQKVCPQWWKILLNKFSAKM
jgi:hypothetical protein